MRRIKTFESFNQLNEKSPCWKGYKQVGTKMKNGKEVPNCVPINENEGPSVECEKCGWMWQLEDGGKDPYVCHKCGHDNTSKNEKQTYDYGCSMIYFDFPKMDEIHSMIEDEDIYTEDGNSHGLETEPHATLLYGLHSDEIEDNDVLHASTKLGIPQELKLHNASCFNNDKYDVLKFDVDDDHLHKINGELTKLPHTTDYPDYHPHSTIAYLKKGTGEKYTNKLKDAWFTVNPSKIVYSKPDGSKIEKSIKR
jgi:2'-5' RNA ligase